MKKVFGRKTLIAAAVLVLGAWATGIVMANTSNEVMCSKPTGIAAVMHAAFFAPSATCAIDKKDANKCQNAAGNCTIAGTTAIGKCTNTASGCQCLKVATP